MMHCNGKCQLYRQLKKAADDEAENNKLPLAVLKIKNLDRYIEMTSYWQPKPIVVLKQTNRFANRSLILLNGYSNSQFKPPQTLA